MNQNKIGLIFLIVVVMIDFSALVFALPSAPDKKGASFYGKLETYEGGKTYAIENIAIGEEGKTKNILLYEKPQSHEPAVKSGERETVELKVDPKTELVKVTVDLNEFIEEEVEVPYRHRLWVFKGKENSRAQDYIEIVRKKKGRITGSYLIESGTMLYANHILDSGSGSESVKSEKLTVPMVTIKSLIIEGYSCPVTESPDNSGKRTTECCAK